MTGDSNTGAAPSFGELLAPVLGQVPDAHRPRFLALLERTAAERYRMWAADLPDHADVLLACAAAEDEIADRIEGAFPCPDDALAELEALVPSARDIYYNAFDGLPIVEQLRLQAAAELQGAAAWRNVASRLSSDAPDRAQLVDALAACSELEERSSAAVTSLLDTELQPSH